MTFVRFPPKTKGRLDALRSTTVRTVRCDLTLHMLVRATLEAFEEMEERHRAEAQAVSLNAEIEMEKQALPATPRKRL